MIVWRLYTNWAAACLLLALLLVLPVAYGQNNRYLGIENGLSNNVVTAIYQDHDGFMWFGTYDGLNRYDGYTFKIFKNVIGDSTSLSANLVYALAGDDKGRLWVGGQKGINVFDGARQSFLHAQFSTERQQVKAAMDEVNCIEPVAGLGMLVGMEHSGLLLFANDNIVASRVRLEGAADAFDFDVTAIEYDPAQQRILVFVDKVGLCAYDDRRHALVVVNDSLRVCKYLKMDSPGKLWVASNNRLLHYDTRTNTYASQYIATRNKILNLCADNTGTLWIATDGDGVWLLPPRAHEAHQLTPALLQSNSVYSVFADSENRKWIGTLRAGISIVDAHNPPFRQINLAGTTGGNKVDNFIMSFSEDVHGNLWIGTDGSGLRYWNRKANTWTSYKHDEANAASISSNFVTGIVQDGDNDVWVSTWFGGVNRLNKRSGTFEHYNCVNPKTKATESNIWFVYRDSRNRLWASATNDGRLYLLNRASNRFELFDERISNLQSFCEDANHNLWGGNYSELIRIDTLKKHHVFYHVGYPVRCIAEDSKKNFWIGTQEGGLLQLDRTTAQFTRFSTKDGLPGNTILRLLEDYNGNLWMSTYNGLSRLDYSERKFRNFSASDGLQSNQFSFNAAAKLQSGELAFGGIHGFNLFYPDSIYQRPGTPPVFLNELRVNNGIEHLDKYLSKTEGGKPLEITVPYNEAAVSIGYVALEFFGADKIRYGYYMDGWDKRWNYVNDLRTANYSRLQEGTYRLMVKSTNLDGNWGPATQLLTIVVLPPWYRTWWAYLVYALIAAGLIYLYQRYRNRQALLKYELRVAHIENEKEKELNEKKLMFFTNISHEFRTPLSLIINPIKDILDKNDGGTDGSEHYELGVVYKNARRLLRLVDQLLLFKKTDSDLGDLKMEAIEVFGLCKEVYSCFIQQARSRKIDYQFECGDKSLAVMVDREKIEITLFNLLSNAFKYTREQGKVRLTVADNAGNVEIKVSDNGIGIPADVGNRLFDKFYQVKDPRKSAAGFGIGLYLVKHFIEAHEGNVTYESVRDKGTTFTITLRKVAVAAPTTATATEVHEQSGIFKEMAEQNIVMLPPQPVAAEALEDLVTERPTLLIVDDDDEIRNYLVTIFKMKYRMYEAWDGNTAFQLARQYLPDLIISDVFMNDTTGIELCRSLKGDLQLSHIPIILLTGSAGDEVELRGLESGADDYIRKPFDKDILALRVATMLKSRTNLQRYFFNEITLRANDLKVSVEYKEFIDKCIETVERHLDNPGFSIKILATEMGMGHSSLYKKVKSVSGQSVTAFIRFIKLRKAAGILINTENNINQAANQAGFNDIKHFREQFNKVFGMNPSEYVKKYRKPFHNTLHYHEKARK